MRLDELYDDDLDEASLADIKKAARNAAIGATMGAAGLAGGYASMTKAPAPTQPAAITQPASAVAQPSEPAKAEPAAVQTKKDDKTGAKEYGSTSMHANREGQSKLLQYARKQGIQGVELAALLAQSAHETSGFHKMVETGSREYFAKYEGKLGNDRPGDGYRYRGRTYLHITGKENYAKIGKAIGVDLVKHPELLEKPEIGLKASIWFWNNRVKPYVKDFSDVIGVTQRIQGSAEGLGDRSSNFDDYRKKLGV